MTRAAAAPMTHDLRTQHERFTQTLQRHAGIVRKVAASYASTRDERSDLMQEIALHLWKAWPSYDPARPVTTWMYRVALNVGISSLRRRKHPARRAVSLEASHEPSTDDDAIDTEQIALLRRLIEDLGPLDRALLILWLDDLNHQDIAEVLGLSASNVATKLHRMKARLRERMHDADEPEHRHARNQR